MHTYIYIINLVNVMTKAKVFGCSLDPEMFERLEEKRGLIPRSAYINQALAAFMDKTDKVNC